MRLVVISKVLAVEYEAYGRPLVAPILRGADLAPAAEPLVDLYRWVAGV